jgi:hypothetical protein
MWEPRRLRNLIRASTTLPRTAPPLPTKTMIA